MVDPVPMVAKREVQARPKPLPPLAVYVGAGVTAVVGGLTLISALDTSSQKATFDASPTKENLDAGKSKGEASVRVTVTVTAGRVWADNGMAAAASGASQRQRGANVLPT